MLRRMIVRWVGAAVVASVAVMPAVAQDFVALPAWSHVDVVEGQDVRIDIAPDYRIVPLGGGPSQVEMRVRIGLGDLQARAPAILAALATRAAGTVQFGFPRIEPPLAGDGAIWVTGLVRIQTRDPLFGAPVDATAQFRLALRPDATPTSVAVTADLAGFELGSELLDVLGVEAALRDVVEGELQRGLAEADAVFTLPPELVGYGIAINAVSVVDVGGGVPGILATASAVLDASQLMTAIIDLTTSLGP